MFEEKFVCTYVCKYLIEGKNSWNSFLSLFSSHQNRLRDISGLSCQLPICPKIKNRPVGNDLQPKFIVMTMFQYKIDCIIHQKLFGLNVPTPFKGCLVKYLLKRRFAVRLLGDKVKENLHNTLILIIGKIHTINNYSCIFFLSSLLLSSATVSYDTLTRWQLMAES